MDVAAVVGTVVVMATTVGGMFMSGSIGGYISVPSVLIVLGGCMGATMLTSNMRTVKATPKLLKMIYKPRKWDPLETIHKIVEFGEKARREGVLSLDRELKNIDDEYMVKAVQLLVDGTEPEMIKDILENELIFTEERHQEGVEMFNVAGQLAPAFGFLGTLIGLIAMLGKLSDPDALGPAMAVALITTLYGVMLSNMLFLPFAGKLKLRNTVEALVKTLIIEGVMSIQSGDNPRMVEDKLKTFLAPTRREHAEKDEKVPRKETEPAVADKMVGEAAAE